MGLLYYSKLNQISQHFKVEKTCGKFFKAEGNTL